MKKYYVVGAVLVALAWFAVVYFYVRVPNAEAPTVSSSSTPVSAHHDYKNISYLIDGSDVALVNGSAETEAAPGSASKIITKYFGNEVMTDLNGDGKDDVVFLLTQETGGSGIFFYIVAALKTDEGYKGSEAYLIGDRIAPQTTEVKDGVVTVNYADRKEGAPFTDQPTEGKSLKLHLDTVAMRFVQQ